MNNWELKNNKVGNTNKDDPQINKISNKEKYALKLNGEKLAVNWKELDKDSEINVDTLDVLLKNHYKVWFNK